MEPIASEGQSFTPDEVRAVREQHKGEVLSDSQVIDMVSDPDRLNLHRVVQWLGYGIERKGSPVNRFKNILQENYPKFSPRQKMRFLQGASRFVILGEKQSFRFHGTRYSDFLDREFETVDVVKLGHGLDESTVVLNTGELLSKSLEFCNGDVDGARRLLRYEGMQRAPTRSDLRKHALGEFFVPLPDSPHKQRVEPYIKSNPKLQELAFLLAVDTGDFSPYNSSFQYLINTIYTRVDGRVKTRIMDYVAQIVSSRGISSRIMKDVSYFVSVNYDLYQNVKTQMPSSPFVTAYEKARDAVNLVNIFEKTKGGRIDTGDLAEILEKTPGLLLDVTEAELELALNSTRDHGVALRIEKLLKARKNLPSAEHLA